MVFISTRGEAPPVGFEEAVAAGLAPDGGLYVPAHLPDLSVYLREWRELSYPQLCARFLDTLIGEKESSPWAAMAEAAYAGFDHRETAPLVDLAPGLRVLELFHGPTLAFKDFALQLLGRIYDRQVSRTRQSLSVLGATSGDTGAAAIEGLRHVRGARVFILYPLGRVSPLQERQMACTGADNVYALAIEGSFDDAQRVLKEIFRDREFAHSVGLSAVNSINLARVLAQCVYYLYAWLRLPQAEQRQTRFIVPTGNFGNILAGWMLRRMGVALGPLRLATNQNDILYRFFKEGHYSPGTVHPSLAPSMDIQIASNFERYLYYLCGEDPARVRDTMDSLARGQDFVVTTPPKDLEAFRVDDAGIRRSIAHIYQNYNYVSDPHTACALAASSRDCPEVILATASPAKFPEVVGAMTGHEPIHPRLEALKGRPLDRHIISPDASVIKEWMRAKYSSPD